MAGSKTTINEVGLLEKYFQSARSTGATNALGMGQNYDSGKLTAATDILKGAAARINNCHGLAGGLLRALLPNHTAKKDLETQFQALGVYASLAANPAPAASASQSDKDKHTLAVF